MYVNEFLEGFYNSLHRFEKIAFWEWIVVEMENRGVEVISSDPDTNVSDALAE